MNDDDEGLVCAYRFDGEGGGRVLGWSEVEAAMADTGYLWVHVDRGAPRARAWLERQSGIPDFIVEALLADESRPRAVVIGEALLVILRGVNLNPGADPEDMVSVRLWIEPGRAISVRRRPLMAVRDLRVELAAGEGPTGPGDFLVHVGDRLMERMGPVLGDLDDQVDQLEDEMIDAESHELRARLRTLRRQAIALRRYIAPQREALNRISGEPLAWLGRDDRQRLREITDRVTRHVEDLDAARERAAVFQDELATRLSEQMNRNMYVLSVIAGVFLPLSLLTGLLGINVGGIPGAEIEWAFAAVTAGIVVLGLIEIWYLRRRRWI